LGQIAHDALHLLANLACRARFDRALAASSPQPRGSSFVVHGTARPDEPFSRFSPGAPLSDAIGFADGGARDETGEIIVVHDRGRGPLVPCERDETRVG